MRLIIQLKDGREKELAIHPAILTALWAGETELRTAWVGWAAQGGLAASTEPGTVRTREAGTAAWGNAGGLDVRLSEYVDCPGDPGFLPYHQKG